MTILIMVSMSNREGKREEEEEEEEDVIRMEFLVKTN